MLGPWRRAHPICAVVGFRGWGVLALLRGPVQLLQVPELQRGQPRVWGEETLRVGVTEALGATQGMLPGAPDPCPGPPGAWPSPSSQPAWDCAALGWPPALPDPGEHSLWA